MIDISIQYYMFELGKSSKELCTICMPFGNYIYYWLPTEICQSPNIAQEAMEDLLRELKEANVYIDDIGVFSHNWSDHRLSFLFSKDIDSLRA
jgi:hypothetical protein